MIVRCQRVGLFLPGSSTSRAPTYRKGDIERRNRRRRKTRNANGQRRKVSQSLYSIQPAGGRSGDGSWSWPRGLCASQCGLRLGMQGTRGKDGGKW
ncbi:hypothetical protein CTAM01_06680 [Colletotrichum tamarilloi]|uniref:Uncharacterized protein n=1 Tax=Colletotrichum tamarilloi TaxID=1209934 RepID=A0ABQ9RAU8_9PEZI|nr:uncharacterized protein CTAM01_06680 [Colletotrichum tamarilloi]KAI3548581.1 hypothetical protein CSPX01_03010 [Colletotrichum filicis]KAK1500081.1 hypothetical protein CTAM01_06680 [Colletotrichum tamarilloi]